MPLIPVARKQVHHFVVYPLALVEIERILRESCRIYCTEGRNAHRKYAVRRRLPKVIKAGPDELTDKTLSVAVFL